MESCNIWLKYGGKSHFKPQVCFFLLLQTGKMWTLWMGFSTISRPGYTNLFLEMTSIVWQTQCSLGPGVPLILRWPISLSLFMEKNGCIDSWRFGDLSVQSLPFSSTATSFFLKHRLLFFTDQQFKDHKWSLHLFHMRKEKHHDILVLYWKKLFQILLISFWLLTN